jgi:3-oxoacyl-[acyl-carrier protein] reductase
MNKEFTNKYAVITGGARGISYDTALLLAERGLSGVVLADWNGELVEQSAKDLEEKKGCQAYAFKTDVSKPEEIEALFAFAGEKLPSIDILINGAAVCPMTPFEDLDADQWDFVMDINLRGAHLCVREVIKYMRPQKYGKIINIASAAARIGGVFSSVSYAASKGGLITATKCYAKILAPDNINVNAVCPGIIKTEMIAGNDYSATIPTIPLKRLGETDDISGVIAFLASEDSKYITGCGIDVNGGIFMF